MTHRQGLPDFRGNSGMSPAKSSANATRRRLDYSRAGAEQRHRFRLLELRDFIRRRCRGGRDDGQLPELREADYRPESYACGCC